MNDLDSQRFAGQLRREGWTRVDRPDDADLVLLNTCTIREKAEEKLYSAIGRFKIIQKTRPSLRIAVAGCVAEQRGAELTTGKLAVDFVLGPGQVERLAGALRSTPLESSAVFTGFDDPIATYDPELVDHPAAFRAMVTIIEGCNMYCTFCVVPFTRGAERSRSLASIVTEVEQLVADGKIEVLLLGQTINAYRCPVSGAGFGALLDRVGAIPGLKRLRFITSHPRWVDEEMISAMGRSDVVCPYLHLPPQSGSDAILNRMKRQYSRAEYLETIAALRRGVPNLTLSGDMIVGFPGETDADFEASMDLLREVRFGWMYSFRFSSRPGTAAGRWPDDVAEPVKFERLLRLQTLQDEIQFAMNADLVGTKMEVLVEGEGRREGQWTGRTACNRLVHFSPIGDLLPNPGQLLTVRIEKSFSHSLAGSPVGTAAQA